jgi:hypothetical protein
VLEPYPLKYPAAVKGEPGPGKNDYTERQRKGDFRAFPWVVDTEDEKNNDKIDDVVKHIITTQGDRLKAYRENHDPLTG